MDTGHLLGSGRSADVYALDDSWVLRRYRDEADATPELVVMSYLSAFGFPVPRIGPPADGAGPGDLVLQRLAGPTMAQALMAGSLDARQGGEMLATLLRELHALPPRLSPDPEVRILHLDLHPENVMLTERGPVVIDWSNTTEGPPGTDRAMSALILAQLSLTPGFPAAEGVRILLTALLTAMAGDGGITPDDLAGAVARRSADPYLSVAERAVLGTAAALVAAHGS
ncbi:aminoglycoside phosphotransferase family protein [Streptomyces sp. AM 2-1-1]|uniref:aminoglycoside phosphotransferase family protein n=1 Tax=unclassified Streptomyces TaxID=2593676 RepID=UPI0023BA2ADA|nr:aminoglycoside phosphotransferase family protein [Streptomyces sp. AM 2-1-1]WEH40460.1 aminoglycoside phosphotransferase family protein [Streptomyces sp. AM 2-1-1]